MLDVPAVLPGEVVNGGGKSGRATSKHGVHACQVFAFQQAAKNLGGNGVVTGGKCADKISGVS